MQLISSSFCACRLSWATRTNLQICPADLFSLSSKPEPRQSKALIAFLSLLFSLSLLVPYHRRPWPAARTRMGAHATQPFSSSPRPPTDWKTLCPGLKLRPTVDSTAVDVQNATQQQSLNVNDCSAGLSTMRDAFELAHLGPSCHFLRFHQKAGDRQGFLAQRPR